MDRLLAAAQFQSTPPVWAETLPPDEVGQIAQFQSTPPVWAETQRVLLHVSGSMISIHSARVGGDIAYAIDAERAGLFQSTPPVWAETAKETIFSSLKHLYYNIFYRKKQENSM